MKDISVESYNEVVVWGLDKISFNYTDTSGSALTFEELDKKLKDELTEEVKIEDPGEYEHVEFDL